MRGAATGILLNCNERSKHMTLFAIVDGGLGAAISTIIAIVAVAAGAASSNNGGKK
jgi:hypothetical protein